MVNIPSIKSIKIINMVIYVFFGWNEWVDLGVSIHGTPIPGWFTMQNALKMD
jgi:hypothetical protein